MNRLYEPDCDFCRIARRGMQGTQIVWEATDWIAFFPLEPATPGHTLVVPRTHVVDLWQASPQLAEQLVEASRRVGDAMRQALHPDGLNLITSSGDAAEQSVFHLHLHVVPRWHNDKFGEIWPSKSPEFSGLTNAATMIRQQLERQEEV